MNPLLQLILISLFLTLSVASLLVALMALRLASRRHCYPRLTYRQLNPHAIDWRPIVHDWRTGPTRKMPARRR